MNELSELEKYNPCSHLSLILNYVSMLIPPNPVISEFGKDLYHVPYYFSSDYQSIDQKTDLLLIFEK